MTHETIQPLEGFAPYFGIDPDDVISEFGTFTRHESGIYELTNAKFEAESHGEKYTIEVDAESISRHVPADHLERVEFLMTERDPLRCTECRKLACICDGA
jgi:hypothetical protein